MKRWWWLGVSVAIQMASAEELCDLRLEQNTKTARAIQFLQSIAGHYQGDTCELSIRVCTGFAETSSSSGSAQVGEVLLIDRRSGDEFYLPLDFQSSSTTMRTRFEIENGRRMFHYEFYDRNPAPGQGSVMTFLFEAVKQTDLSALKYVEFGLRRPTDKRLQWAVCQLAKIF
ncbi:MAG: hypothetical protein AB7N80_11445 [Bdellovibrionales bacterium]